MSDDFLKNIRDDHHNFDKGRLEYNVHNNPLEFFKIWFKEAYDSEQQEPHALVVSTVDENGQPSSRVVYLKEVTDEGVIFYTNYLSQKGSDLKENPKVAGLLFWNKLERQVRIEGEAVKVSPEKSDAYFNSRPRGSQLGAWASNQSEELVERDELEQRTKEFSEKFPDKVPRPPHWGGYLLKPTRFEFWQGRKSRLHDRIVFDLQTDASWKIFRKNP